MSLPSPPVLLISDRAAADPPLAAVAAAAFRAGCRWAMVREKDLATPALAALAGNVVRVARPFGAVVLVNGDAAAARSAGADGVHLPRGRAVARARDLLGPRAIVGVSAHDLAEVEAAARNGADYVTVSPVFPSISKPGYGPVLGREGLARIACAAGLPVVALGGVTRDNAASCLAAGARGVAVMGSVMRAADPGAAVGELVTALGWAINKNERGEARHGRG